MRPAVHFVFVRRTAVVVTWVAEVMEAEKVAQR